MAVTREQFEQGMTYDAYKAQMTRNKEKVEQNEQSLQLKPEDLAAFKSAKPLKVLALAEDWCGDVVANLPILGRIAKDSGTLDVRVLLRDQDPGSAVMDQYLKDGQFKSIPVFVFLDDNFDDKGVFIERPDSVTNTRAERRKKIYEANPAYGDPSKPPTELPDELRVPLQAEIAKMNEEMAPWANQEVVSSLRKIVAPEAATVA
jgi:hypothetical protein